MKFPSLMEQYGVPLIGVILLAISLVIPSTIVAYAFTLILAVLALIKPKQSILFLLIYFPLRSFLIEVNPALKLMGDVIIIFAFLHVVWKARKDIKSIFKFEIYEWAFIGFLVVGSVSALITGVSIGAIIFQLRAFVITFLLLYIVKRLQITKKDVVAFLVVTAAVAALLVVQGLIEKLSLRSAWMPEKWVNRQLSPNNRSRIYGLINNPNVLAVHLTIAMCLTYYLKKFVTKMPLQWVLNLLILSMAGVWILTFSRGTWIAAAIGLGVYFLLTFNWKFIVKAGVTVGLAFALIATPSIYLAQWIGSHTEIGNFERTGTPEEEPGFADVESNRIKETFTADTMELSKTTGRLFIVNKGFEVFKDHPIIGTGFSTYGDSASKTYSSPIYEDYGITFNIYSDNQYIQVIAQTGVAGVLLFAVFLLGILAVFWKYRHNTPSTIPMLAGLIGIYWCGLIYNIWEDKAFTLYFYILTAAFVTFAKNNKCPE